VHWTDARLSRGALRDRPPALDPAGRANCLLAPRNSLLLVKYSLLGLQKFPVPLRREFACKRLILRTFWTPKIGLEAFFSKNSL
jgi:hypothetical protein